VRPRVFLISLLLLGLLAPPAPTAPERTVDQDIARCQTHMKRGKWKAALAGWRAIFVDHAGSGEVVRRLPEIEKGLETSLYRSTARPVGPKDIFGWRVEKWNERKNELTIEFPHGPDGKLWKETGDHTWLYDVPFDGSISIDWYGYVRTKEMPTVRSNMVLLCCNEDLTRYYRILPGLQYRKFGSDDIWEHPAIIERVDEKGTRELCRKVVISRFQGAGGHYFVSRKGSSIKVRDHRKKLLASASDGKLKGGRIVLSAKKPKSIGIQGIVDGNWYEKQVGGILASRFRQWREGAWDRKKEIPAWARDPGTAAPVAGGAATGATLPGDAPKGMRDALEEAWGLFANGKVLELTVHTPTLGKLPANSDRFVRSLRLLAIQANARAEALLSELIEAEPAFGRAWLLRGIARYRLRRIEPAAKDLLAAIGKGAGDELAYRTLVMVELFRRDMEAAARRIAEAAGKGIRTKRLEMLSKWIERARKGPVWARRHRHEGRTFHVESDHSKEVCREVGQMLESALVAQLNRFPGVRRPGVVIKAHVFSSREEFIGYGGELGENLRNAAGRYSPLTRELLLYLPTHDVEALRPTAQHECFHAFLHEFADDIPRWFDEGHAEYFGMAVKVDGHLDFDRPDPASITTLGKLRAVSRRQVEDLLTMGPAMFMTDARRNYALSWALVHFLESTPESRLRSLNRKFFAALRAGEAPRDASRATYGPHLDALATGLTAHIQDLVGK
jgi:hypothetical protein